MRHLLVAIAAAAALGATAQAQQRRTYGAAPSVAPSQGTAAPRPNPQLSSPPQVPAAPPVVFSLPPLMPQPAGGITHDLPGFLSHDLDAREFSPLRRRPKGLPLYGAYVPGYIMLPVEPEAPPEAASAAPPNGQLRLSVIPDHAQVFVDGFYVGTVADVADRSGLRLAAGPHRLELRAIGYRSEQVDIAIAPNDTLTYRGELDSGRPTTQESSTYPASPTPAPIATGSNVIYLIPNCYLGNVPPRPSRLPVDCDISKVEVLGRQ